MAVRRGWEGEGFQGWNPRPKGGGYIPEKTNNFEAQNEGLEDDFPFQRGDFQVNHVISPAGVIFGTCF